MNNDALKKLRDYIFGTKKTIVEEQPYANVTKSVPDQPNVIQRARSSIENLLSKYGGNQPTPSPQQQYKQVPQKAQTPYPVQPTTAPQQQYQPTAQPVQTERVYGRKPETQNVNSHVYDAIEKAAKKYNVPVSFMLDLGFTESSLDPTLTNLDAPNISPQGLYQFTNSTWKDVQKYANDPTSSLYGVLPNNDRFDPVTNSLAAAYLISNGQLGKWDASEWNWGNEWTPQELEALGFYNQSIYQKQNPGMRASVRLGGKKN